MKLEAPYKRILKGDPKKKKDDCYLIDPRKLRPIEELVKAYEQFANT